MPKIIKNINIPDRVSEFGTAIARGKPSKWPISKLKVGDGFKEDKSKTNAIRTSIQHYQRWYPGVKFKTQIVEDKILVKRIS